MLKQYSSNNTKSYQFSIAPMLDCTDRHFRVLMRQISKKALLYTEMIVAQSLHYTQRRDRLLDFDLIEHPIALQLGGDNPKLLAEAACIAEDWGYDEVNLNIGCPSPRVQSGNFGACLMAEPKKVAYCIESMTKATRLPITVKHRIGIDNLDNLELLIEFVDHLSIAGAKRFAVHARKAWLKGLNPKQNRTIPPLQYERVAELKAKRPNLLIELNGGLQTPSDCLQALTIFDGAMVGRAAYEHPLRWQHIDEVIFGGSPKSITASDVIQGILPYAEKHLNNGGNLWDICKHVIQIVEGVHGARKWRHELSVSAQKKNANLKVLEHSAKQLKDAGL